MNNLDEIARLDAEAKELAELEKAEIAKPETYPSSAIGLAEAARTHQGRPLGFKTLDALLDGVSSGELIVISAATGVGKSTFAKTIIWNLAQEKIPSLFYSLEESTWNFIQPFLANDPEVRWQPDGTLSKVGDYPIYWPIDAFKIDFERLRQVIRYAYLKYGIQHVFIDHLFYLLDHKAVESSRSISLHIGDRLRKLRQIAYQTGVSIFLVTHITKTEDGKDPTANDLHSSSFVGQEADAIIMLSRKRLSEPVKEMKDGIEYFETFSPIVRCKVEKARRTGNRGAFDLLFINRLYKDPAGNPMLLAQLDILKDKYEKQTGRLRPKS